MARELLATLQAENPKASPAEIANLFVAEVRAALDRGETQAFRALTDGPMREWLEARLDEMGID
jgi:hypothetical protein